MCKVIKLPIHHCSFSYVDCAVSVVPSNCPTTTGEQCLQHTLVTPEKGDYGGNTGGVELLCMLVHLTVKNMTLINCCNVQIKHIILTHMA